MEHVLLFLFCCYSVLASCNDNGSTHPDGDKWVRNGNFLVTCVGKDIKVLKCLTDGGTVLELGTESHVEHGVEYSCIDDEINIEGCF
uniref:Secreted protein n=1 Tax=Heterorhabditis bacteriophora TaxID=37862 RepID=A0A1I7WCN4_HETBA